MRKIEAKGGMKNILGSRNSNIDKNAYLNWRTSRSEKIHNMTVLAEGYYLAALIVADSVLEDNTEKRADCLIYPMVFDLNQCIELYLKSLMWTLNCLLEKDESFDGGHHIINLYGKVRSRFYEFESKHPETKGDREEFNRMIAGVDAYISEIKEVIPEEDWKTMDYPRYPLMKDKSTDHFYVKKTENITIDMEYFRFRLMDIYNALDSLNAYFFEMLLYREEKYAEWK